MGLSVVLGGALVILMVWAASLIGSDVRNRRLPDALTLPPAAAGVLTVSTLEPHLLFAGLSWAALYLALGLAGGGVGGGDIKLAASLGMVLGVVAGLPGVLLAVALAGLFSVTIMAARRSGSLPHGPPMILATVFAGALSVIFGWE